MRSAMQLAEPLYQRTGRTLCFVRAANQTVWVRRRGSQGELRPMTRTFFADQRRLAPRSETFTLAGLGSFVPLVNTYAGSWAYPRSVMHDFMREPQWQQKADERDLRASAARGFSGCGARARSFGLPMSNWTASCAVAATLPFDLRTYHMTHSGEQFASTLQQQKVLWGYSPLSWRQDATSAPAPPATRSPLHGFTLKRKAYN